MSLAAIWDRFWWSLMLTILVGLLWLKFIDPIIPCMSVGLLLCSLVGGIYLAIGLRKMIRQKRHEEEIERRARAELRAEFGEGALK